MKRVVTICAVVLLAGNVVWADPSWETFVIRNSNSGGVAPTITDLGGGWLEFDVDDGGQKAGWGTNSMNGRTIGEIASVSITRAGGGQAVGGIEIVYPVRHDVCCASLPREAEIVAREHVAVQSESNFHRFTCFL